MAISNIPPRTIDALDRYVEHRIPTGGFLQAVLENDLFAAMGKADVYNRQSLFDIVEYIYNELPRACWGSPDAVKAWLEVK